MNESFVLGLDLGGTSIKAVALTPDGAELARDVETFDLSTKLAFLDAGRAVAHRIEGRLGRRARSIGLSAPGIAAKDGRSIACMPGRFEGLTGLNWGEAMGRGSIPVLNDARAALLGEVWLGAARGARDAILLTLGTGVGGAAMMGGRLLQGHSGKAGHLGHVTLDPEGPLDITQIPGSLEDAIGNHQIAARTHGRFATTLDLVRAHEAGDLLATTIWLSSVRALAASIASLGNVLDPEVVIVGGGISRCGETLFRPLREFVGLFEWRIAGHSMQIVPAKLGEYAGAYGAAWQGMPDDLRPSEGTMAAKG